MYPVSCKCLVVKRNITFKQNYNLSCVFNFVRKKSHITMPSVFPSAETPFLDFNFWLIIICQYGVLWVFGCIVFVWFLCRRYSSQPRSSSRQSYGTRTSGHYGRVNSARRSSDKRSSAGRSSDKKANRVSGRSNEERKSLLRSSSEKRRSREDKVSFEPETNEPVLRASQNRRKEEKSRGSRNSEGQPLLRSSKDQNKKQKNRNSRGSRNSEEKALLRSSKEKKSKEYSEGDSKNPQNRYKKADDWVSNSNRSSKGTRRSKH